VSVAQSAVVVVLAAGRGTRFGAGVLAADHKLGQPFGASTVLGCTLANVVESGLPLVVVTTQALHELVGSVVAERDVIVLPAANSAETGLPLGMGYSIAAGVMARSGAAGWLLLPGDMPLVRPSSLCAVASALPQHLVAYAQYAGQRGHPVGFGSELYSELAKLGGDEGARRLVARYPAHGVELADDGVLLDLDTPQDLQRLRAAYAERTAALTD
jgi:molybdenum cofactor cytidylyltransferase